jgi:hypothetical protein
LVGAELHASYRQPVLFEGGIAPVSRIVAIRSSSPLSEEFLQTVDRNCKLWQERIQEFIAQNQDKDWIVSSSYVVGSPQRRDKENEIFVVLSGTPSLGLMKILEDCFPLNLLHGVASDEIYDLEVGYFNSGLGVSAWRSLTEYERKSILTG